MTPRAAPENWLKMEQAPPRLHQEAVMFLQDWWTKTTNLSLFYLSYACLVNLDDFKGGTVKGIKKIHWDTSSGHLLRILCCACRHYAALISDSPTQSQEQLKVRDVSFFLFAFKSSFSFLLLQECGGDVDFAVFPHKWHLFRPLVELIDKGWERMTCGTWYAVIVVSMSDQGRQKSLLFSWAEEAV